MKRNLFLGLVLMFFFNCTYSQNISDSNCFSVSQMLDKSNHDSLSVFSGCDVLDFKIEVYNRWGEVLFTAFEVGKIDIFKQESGTQIQTTKKKVKKKSMPVVDRFSEGQYNWVISYFSASDISRKEQKKQNGIIYITE